MWVVHGKLFTKLESGPQLPRLKLAASFSLILPIHCHDRAGHSQTELFDAGTGS